MRNGRLMIMGSGAMNRFLAFHPGPGDERRPCRVDYLSKAASAAGSLSSSRNCQNRNIASLIYAKDVTTGPTSYPRAHLDLENLYRRPCWDRKTDPALEAKFRG